MCHHDLFATELTTASIKLLGFRLASAHMALTTWGSRLNILCLFVLTDCKARNASVLCYKRSRSSVTHSLTFSLCLTLSSKSEEITLFEGAALSAAGEETGPCSAAEVSRSTFSTLAVSNNASAAVLLRGIVFSGVLSPSSRISTAVLPWSLGARGSSF